MKLLNHPSIIQDIIDISLMLPGNRDFELVDEGDTDNPIIDFLYHVRDVAIKISEYKYQRTWMHNAEVQERREEQAKAASQSGDRQ